MLSYDTPVSTISMYALAVAMASMKYIILLSYPSYVCAVPALEVDIIPHVYSKGTSAKLCPSASLFG
jgi:hypothetical protein